jgi:hypothetical protein
MGKRQLVLSATVLLNLTTTMASAESPIAGLRPSERPVDAPIITSFNKSGQWYRLALTGVEPPYPASLRFLEDQGAWYTPFTHPGMANPYDLRGWHSSDSTIREKE